MGCSPAPSELTSSPEERDFVTEDIESSAYRHKITWRFLECHTIDAHDTET